MREVLGRIFAKTGGGAAVELHDDCQKSARRRRRPLQSQDWLLADMFEE
jgi:hypothetical protein